MTIEELETRLTDSVARLSQSVVRVSRPASRGPERDAPFYPEGSGTGVVVDPEGFIVTNDHVVRGAPTLKVRLPDDREVTGLRVGEDPLTDLAVIRIPPSGVPAAQLGDSDRIKVGQFALAVGNSLGLPGGPTVSVGVISALNRPLPGSDFVFEGLLQTDAAINPGNSGGPLADISGSVVGINTAMVPFAQGVGFAVPVNTVRRVMSQLRTAGRVVRPWLGIVGLAYAPDGSAAGVPVTEIMRGSPAHAAGLRPGDTLVRVGTQDVGSLRDLLRTLGDLPIGGAVDVTFVRDRQIRKSVIRIEESRAPA